MKYRIILNQTKDKYEVRAQNEWNPNIWELQCIRSTVTEAKLFLKEILKIKETEKKRIKYYKNPVINKEVTIDD